MAVMNPPRADIDLLMRSAEELLLVATDEARLLDVATELLAAQYGYGARYVALHDDATAELYLGGAAGALAETPEVRAYRRPDSAGLSGACWTSARVVNVPDVREDPRYMRVLPACRSEICVPIVAGDKVLGVLGVQSEHVAAFSADDEQLLSAYARLLAMALTHARIHTARQRDIAELQAVGSVARTAAALDLDATLAAVSASFRTITTSDSVAVYLWDTRSERLKVSALSHDPVLFTSEYAEKVREKMLALGEGLTGWTAQTREPVLLNDVAKDGRAIALRGVSLENKSAILVPLVVRDRLVGVVRALKIGTHAYTEEHFRFAQTLALQAALAIAAAEAHEEIRRLSVTDELTGAYNVRHVMQRLREEMEFAKRHDDCVSLLVIDGDAMKMVNDQYGHAEGNRVLVEITGAMRGTLRVSDVLGRFGGDEFIVVLPRTTARDALITAERLRLAVAARDFRNSWGEPIRATVSVGVATYPQNGATPDDLFRIADRALYAAKLDGRNRVTAAH
ncbi:MAG TPA: sensor domain-containing diguanylate cyclase [Candidatus Limnocylindrales bacterium]|nr:sensor domain-containing diguanylate cyclase [Candidatus Limnocylindrales bacterium]